MPATIKIGVVSDTHSRKLPQQMVNDFKNVDWIIHAGDFCELADYAALAKIKETKAVQGNMDNPDIRKRFPRRQIIEAGRFRIGVFHGEGARVMILKSVQNEFQGEDLDVIVFGHSHQAFNEKIDKTLYFNPGSPNDDIVAPYCSYGTLEIMDKKLVGKIIKV